MIVIEYMENGALDAFLRVSTKMKICKNIPCYLYVYVCLYIHMYIICVLYLHVYVAICIHA